MQTIHSIRIWKLSDKARAAFAEAGVELTPDAWSHTVAENDPQWAAVEALVERFNLDDVARVEYSDEDRNAADFLRIQSRAQMGYPQPAMDGSYRSATFDLAGYCKFCGIGQIQKAPFRLKKTPASARSIMGLNCICDELFVNLEVWKEVFEPLGIGCRPLVLDRTGAEIASVVQLEIPQVAGLPVEGFPCKVCRRCGRTRYDSGALRLAPCPKPDATGAPIFKSSQYFGSGAMAYHLILVSRLVFQKIGAAGLTRVNFVPCAR
jgi:hypothetical protein